MLDDSVKLWTRSRGQAAMIGCAHRPGLPAPPKGAATHAVA